MRFASTVFEAEGSWITRFNLGMLFGKPCSIATEVQPAKIPVDRMPLFLPLKRIVPCEQVDDRGDRDDPGAHFFFRLG
jgi:hypothetical protein